MNEWSGQQISIGALLTGSCWVLGLAVVAGASLGYLDPHWAAFGQVVFSIGSLRLILEVLGQLKAREREAFDMGAEVARMRPRE